MRFDWWGRHGGLISGALLVVLLLVVIGRLISWAPELITLTDGALIELNTYAASEGKQWLGPYSRFGWMHPGPMYFYLLAPLYKLSGFHALALNVGALILNLLVIGIAAAVPWSAWRAGSLAILSGIALYLVRFGGLLVSAWNPHALVLPLAAFMVVTSSVTPARARLIPLCIGLGTLIVQTHAGLAIPVAATLAASLVVALLVDGPTAYRRHFFWLGAAAVCGAFLWAPPVVDQLTGTQNMSKLWSFFTGSSEPTQEFTTAVFVWSSMLMASVRPDAEIPVGRAMATNPEILFLVVSVVQIAALMVVAGWSRGRTVVSRFALMGLIASLSGLAAVCGIRGEIGAHQVFWLSIVGLVNMSVLVGALCQNFCATRAKTTAVVSRIFVVITIAGFIFLSNRELAGLISRASQPGTDERDVKTASRNAIAVVHTAGAPTPLFEIADDAWQYAAGIVIQMLKHGIRVVVEEEWIPMIEVPASGPATAAVSIRILPAGAQNGTCASGMLKTYTHFSVCYRGFRF